MGDTELNLDETKLEKSLEEEVANNGDTETLTETTTEKTDEKTSEEVSTETETPQKTEETAKEAKKAEETEEDTRFDKHPRWIKRQQQLDEAQDKVRQYESEIPTLREFKERLGNLDVDEITRLKTASELLRKYPTLAEKVQKDIDEFQYGNEELKTKLQTIEDKQARFEENQETQKLVERYDNEVGRLIKDSKVDKEIEPYVKELLDSRVINQRITIDKVPQAFEKVLKDIDLIVRKKMASHIETKKAELKVPKSPAQLDKVITSKNESTEAADVVDELTNALKSSRAEISSE